MGKNTASRKSNANADEKPPEKAMEEQVKYFMTLNAKLLKDAIDNRREMKRSGSEKSALRNELDEVSDANLGLMLESDILMGVVKDYVRELDLEVVRFVNEKDEVLRNVETEKGELMKERDTFKIGFDSQVEQVNRLMENSIRLESENVRLVQDKDDLKRIVGDYEKDIESLLNAKSDHDDVEIKLRKEIEKLEKEIVKLEGYGEIMRKEVSVLQDMVMDLERNLKDSHEKEIEMKGKIDALGKVEAELKRVMKEKRSVEEKIRMLQVLASGEEKVKETLANKVEELSNALAEAELKIEEADKALDAVKTNEAILEEELEKVKIEGDAALKSKEDLIEKMRMEAELKIEEADKALDAEKSHLGEELEKVKMEGETVLKSKQDLIEKMRMEADKALDAEKSRREELEKVKMEGETALKSKVDLIEKMTMEAETMQQAIMQAHGKKKFWTFVSQITTVSAAASFLHALLRSR